MTFQASVVTVHTYTGKGNIGDNAFVTFCVNGDPKPGDLVVGVTWFNGRRLQFQSVVKADSNGQSYLAPYNDSVAVPRSIVHQVRRYTDPSSKGLGHNSPKVET